VFASVEVLCLLPSGVPAGGGPGSMPVLPAAVLLLTAGLLVVRLRPATTC